MKGIMPIPLGQFLTQIHLKINVLQAMQNSLFHSYRTILRGCFPLVCLICVSSHTCGDEVFAQGVDFPPNVDPPDPRIINNLNVKSRKLLKIPDPLENLKTTIKLSCAKANLFLFIHRPMNVTTPYDPLEDYAIWHDLRFTTKMDQLRNVSIDTQKIKSIQLSETHSDRPRLLQATKLVITKDNKILLTGGVPIERSICDCHPFPFIYLRNTPDKAIPSP